MDAEDGRFITDGVPGIPHDPAEGQTCKHGHQTIKQGRLLDERKWGGTEDSDMLQQETGGQRDRRTSRTEFYKSYIAG